jgi:predicted GIY-YIG superfamily endonuclease
VRRIAKSRAKRNTYIYRLKQGNTTVYIGQTKDRDRRKHEHRNEGKKFTRMQTQFPISEKVANKKEQEAIKGYQRRHKGKKPKYND